MLPFIEKALPKSDSRFPHGLHTITSRNCHFKEETKGETSAGRHLCTAPFRVGAGNVDGPVLRGSWEAFFVRGRSSYPLKNGWGWGWVYVGFFTFWPRCRVLISAQKGKLSDRAGSSQANQCPSAKAKKLCFPLGKPFINHWTKPVPFVPTRTNRKHLPTTQVQNTELDH